MFAGKCLEIVVCTFNATLNQTCITQGRRYLYEKCTCVYIIFF